jgi:TrmH family RNA methyltransferase
MTTPIASLQNAHVKAVVKLGKRRQRDRTRTTIVEGTREIARALARGVTPVEAYVCDALVRDAEGQAIREQLEELAAARRTRLYPVTPEVFARMAYREESGGLLLVIPYLETDLNSLPLGDPPFLAVIEGVEKPGNLGAILRTADAAGVDGVIVCRAPGQPATDVHNPNVVRASLGTLFSVSVAEADSATVIDWLRARGARVVITSPDATTRYTRADMRGPVAVVMGSESHGLSPRWFAAADEQVVIPMHGMADSLNLATSTALLLYEVVRQRTG